MSNIKSHKHEKHLVFIGRWNPLHEGHKTIMLKKYVEKDLPLLVLVRDTSFDEVPAKKRANTVLEWLEEEGIRGRVNIIPDIEGVYYGRGVGYNVEEIEVSKEIAEISGTKIRENLKNNKKPIMFGSQRFKNI